MNTKTLIGLGKMNKNDIKSDSSDRNWVHQTPRFDLLYPNNNQIGLPAADKKPHLILRPDFLGPRNSRTPLLLLHQPTHPQNPHSYKTQFHPLVLKRSPTVSMSMEAGIGVMGTKLGMMSYFEAEGKVVPVTVKTEATDGYNAVQVGYRRVRDRKLTKPELGHLQKADVIPMRHLQEFRLQSVDGFETSQKLDFGSCLRRGIWWMLLGIPLERVSKAQLQMTHGSKSHRTLGSIGAGTTPGRVYKGKKMPGRMGGTKTKIRKLPIVKIDSELRVVMIKGALPGKPGNPLRITPAKIVSKNIPKN
uniref:Large ribosomal subunit protein uL3c n=1 Tax=Kalanchoe fedtschenkoi TaxID=63787 RepID=A0A7N0ZRI6_KALFE